MSSSSTVQRVSLRSKPSRTADKWFFGIARAAGYSSFVIVAAILFFLLLRAWPTFTSEGVLDFTFATGWNSVAEPPVFHLGPMLYGSLLIAAMGVVLAVPMAISIAYYIVFMAPKRFATVATVLVDLLAAIPSIVIGLWGLIVFSPVASEWARLLNEAMGFIPVFSNSVDIFLRSPFIASWVIAVMIVPIISSITREIFSQLDQEMINGALALGGSRESILRKVILPTASGGIVGATLLGLGRAMGETVAIFFVLNLTFDSYNWFQILEPSGGAVASLILARFTEALEGELSALLAAGVVLFVVTLIINSIASYIVAKSQPWRKL
jgi:phosphate transport system permease protein